MLPTDQYSEYKSFQLNGGPEPSPLKAKLFMSYKEAVKERPFIQSGDVVRLNHMEIKGYLTVSQVDVES